MKHGMELHDTFATFTKFDGKILHANEPVADVWIAVVLFTQGFLHLLGTEEWELFTTKMLRLKPDRRLQRNGFNRSRVLVSG